MKATCYEHTENGFVYTVSLTKDGWGVLRNPDTDPNLVPLRQELTDEGWISVINLNANIASKRFPDAKTALKSAMKS